MTKREAKKLTPQDVAGIVIFALTIFLTAILAVTYDEAVKAEQRKQRRIDHESGRPLRMIFDNRLPAMAYRYKPCVAEILWWPDGSVTLADTNGKRVESSAGHGGK